MQKFIKEVLRMYTPGPFNLIRYAVKDHFINQFKINKGDMSISCFGINSFKEQFFEDPYVFKPDRWDKNQNVD